MTPSTLRFLLLAAGLGGLGGLLMARFMDAVQRGETLIAVACAAGYLVTLLLVWRFAQRWRSLKGLNQDPPSPASGPRAPNKERFP